MIHSEPGPHAFLLKQPSELSVREHARHWVPMWANVQITYHDNKSVSNLELIELRCIGLRQRAQMWQGTKWFDPEKAATAQRSLDRMEARIRWVIQCRLGLAATDALYT